MGLCGNWGLVGRDKSILPTNGYVEQSRRRLDDLGVVYLTLLCGCALCQRFGILYIFLFFLFLTMLGGMNYRPRSWGSSRQINPNTRVVFLLEPACTEFSRMEFLYE